MTAALKSDLETRFAQFVKAGEMRNAVAHTSNYEEGEKFKKVLQEMFPAIPVIFCDPLSLSVSCHIGPGALACACMRAL